MELSSQEFAAFNAATQAIIDAGGRIQHNNLVQTLTSAGNADAVAHLHALAARGVLIRKMEFWEGESLPHATYSLAGGDA